MIELMPHQKEALDSLGNGRILYGGVGSGKSATAMAYYMKKEYPRDVIVITTAKKRDSLEWVGEAAKFGIGTHADGTTGGLLTVDSWNNIGRYQDLSNHFFIFDEQRLVGHGAWVKSFLRIARSNRWILLSATPGDTWLDYAPVFIANGWYKNITEFKRRHVIYAPYLRFPKVTGYIGERELERRRNEILVEMPYIKHTERLVNWMEVGFDQDALRRLQKTRWNPFDNKPIKDVAELWRLSRMVVNTDPSRLEMIHMLIGMHPRLIVYYNFNYELEILRKIKDQFIALDDFEVAEWNGYKHEEIPETGSWVYLVQYTAGSEGWNCVSTDAMAFYSLTYSYKNFMQAQGRIDRLNTSYKKLYYYVLFSASFLDRTNRFALAEKNNFNVLDTVQKWENQGFPVQIMDEMYT